MELKRTRTQLEVANGDKRRVETQRLALQAELHVLQDKAAEALQGSPNRRGHGAA